MHDMKKPMRLFAALVVLLGLAPSAFAVRYGEIEVLIENELAGEASHGYAELLIRVVNHSSQSGHQVRLTYPKSGYSYGGDHLRAVTRTVSVEPGKSVRVSIAYPERLEVRGNGLGVNIDGSEEDNPVPVNLSTHGYRTSRYGSGAGSSQTLVLYSRAVDTRFPDWVNQAEMGKRLGGRAMAVAGSPGMVRSNNAPESWSPNWLGYTRFDGIVVTADELRAMPAEVRSALGQYVECGGSLFILGRDPPLPGAWNLRRIAGSPMSVAAPGFGQCYATHLSDLSAVPHQALSPILESWSKTQLPWQQERSANAANRAFPVVDDIGVPVKGLLALMFLFAILIGPVNLVLLTRKKRKLWMFWTVPLISFLTCVMVLGYMAITEGWQGRSRIEGVTVLDENSRRASTIGWTGFYTPLLPGGGLHFLPETEATFQNGEDNGYHSYRRGRSDGAALTIDWTRDQHFASGWMSPRVQALHAAHERDAARTGDH
ncbi:MAG TPA: hypothetical protein VGL71_02930 [Urbifossiella sp.]|jgi:hypothetical protein